MNRYRIDCLYDVDWQVLRISMLNPYNDYGGWSTPEGAAINLKKLDLYRQEATDKDEHTRRLWRILNVLNAALVHQPMARIAKNAYSKVFAPVRADLDMMTDWDWSKVEIDLELLIWRNPKAFYLILIDMQGRRKKAVRLKDDSALAKFLRLMENLKEE